MSFVRIGEFLGRAFVRIDRKNYIQEKKTVEALGAIFTLLISSLTEPPPLTYKNGVIFVHTSSQTLKQKIYLLKGDIIKKIKNHSPHLQVSDIAFKEPLS